MDPTMDTTPPPPGNTTALKQYLLTQLMPMDEMLSVFYTSTTTALWSESWWPLTTAQYAGTCIFLIVLAFVYRGLLVMQSRFEGLYARWVRRRDTRILRVGREGDKDGVQVVEQEIEGGKWRVDEVVARGVMDLVVAGVGHLLMLAVMTMNVGYFMSTLAGIFLGGVVLGGYARNASGR